MLKSLKNGSNYYCCIGNDCYITLELCKMYLTRSLVLKFSTLFQDADPFWVDPAGPVLIGTSQIILKSLGYLIETQEKLPITDFKGNDEGKLCHYDTPLI